jgi:hypothetical protein
MDVLWFLKRRTAFIRHFYERASRPFVETKQRIEAQEPPFDDAPFDDSGEPPFLEEWQDADEAVEFLGQACVSFLATSVKLYLRESEGEFRRRWGRLFEFPSVTVGEPGVITAYEEWFREFGIDFRDSQLDVNLIHEIVTTRNLAQHPKSIGFMHLSQRNIDFRRFPKPFFAHPLEKAFFKRESEHEIPWMLSITGDALLHAIREVEEFCEWLERQWRTGPKAVPRSVVRAQGDLVGEVSHYFPKLQVVAIKLLADVSLGQTVRFSKGEFDFEQQITSMQVDHSAVQLASAGAEVGLKVEIRVPEGAKVYRRRQT